MRLRKLLVVWIAFAVALGPVAVPSVAAAGQDCAQAAADDDCRCAAGVLACEHACSICHAFATAAAPLAVAGPDSYPPVANESSPLTSLARAPETGPPKRLR